MLGPVVLDVEGTVLTDNDRRRLAHPLVGMVILFSRNYADKAQLTELCEQIHAARPGILIAVDHEGGRVQRFTEGFTKIPSMRTFGNLWIDDPEDAVRRAVATGFVMASELRACGVDLTFAPCLDIDFQRCEVIGHRAFSQNPKTVTHLALAISQGMRLAGMSNCGKHFPGHGWVSADSHQALPVDERTFDRLLFADLKPYRWMGEALDSVMVAHVLYEAIDEKPAGFSKHWIGKVLREQLHFTGCVFSDDLCMKGAWVAGDIDERAQAALSAGCDMLIVCNDFAASDRLLERVQWHRGEHFDERFERLRPKGEALSWQALKLSSRYQAALKIIPEESAA